MGIDDVVSAPSSFSTRGRRKRFFAGDETSTITSRALYYDYDSSMQQEASEHKSFADESRNSLEVTPDATIRRDIMSRKQLARQETDASSKVGPPLPHMESNEDTSGMSFSVVLPYNISQDGSHELIELDDWGEGEEMIEFQNEEVGSQRQQLSEADDSVRRLEAELDMILGRNDAVDTRTNTTAPLSEAGMAQALQLPNRHRPSSRRNAQGRRTNSRTGTSSMVESHSVHTASVAHRESCPIVQSFAQAGAVITEAIVDSCQACMRTDRIHLTASNALEADPIYSTAKKSRPLSPVQTALSNDEDWDKLRESQSMLRKELDRIQQKVADRRNKREMEGDSPAQKRRMSVPSLGAVRAIRRRHRSLSPRKQFRRHRPLGDPNHEAPVLEILVPTEFMTSHEQSQDALPNNPQAYVASQQQSHVAASNIPTELMTSQQPLHLTRPNIRRRPQHDGAPIETLHSDLDHGDENDRGDEYDSYKHTGPPSIPSLSRRQAPPTPELLARGVIPMEQRHGQTHHHKAESNLHFLTRIQHDLSQRRKKPPPDAVSSSFRKSSFPSDQQLMTPDHYMDWKNVSVHDEKPKQDRKPRPENKPFASSTQHETPSTKAPPEAKSKVEESLFPTDLLDSHVAKESAQSFFPTDLLDSHVPNRDKGDEKERVLVNQLEEGRHEEAQLAGNTEEIEIIFVEDSFSSTDAYLYGEENAVIVDWLPQKRERIDINARKHGAPLSPVIIRLHTDSEEEKSKENDTPLFAPHRPILAVHGAVGTFDPTPQSSALLEVDYKVSPPDDSKPWRDDYMKERSHIARETIAKANRLETYRHPPAPPQVPLPTVNLVSQPSSLVKDHPESKTPFIHEVISLVSMEDWDSYESTAPITAPLASPHRPPLPPKKPSTTQEQPVSPIHAALYKGVGHHSSQLYQPPNPVDDEIEIISLLSLEEEQTKPVLSWDRRYHHFHYRSSLSDPIPVDDAGIMPSHNPQTNWTALQAHSSPKVQQKPVQRLEIIDVTDMCHSQSEENEQENPDPATSSSPSPRRVQELYPYTRRPRPVLAPHHAVNGGTIQKTFVQTDHPLGEENPESGDTISQYGKGKMKESGPTKNDAKLFEDIPRSTGRDSPRLSNKSDQIISQTANSTKDEWMRPSLHSPPACTSKLEGPSLTARPPKEPAKLEAPSLPSRRPKEPTKLEAPSPPARHPQEPAASSGRLAVTFVPDPPGSQTVSKKILSSRVERAPSEADGSFVVRHPDSDSPQIFTFETVSKAIDEGARKFGHRSLPIKGNNSTALLGKEPVGHHIAHPRKLVPKEQRRAADSLGENKSDPPTNGDMHSKATEDIVKISRRRRMSASSQSASMTFGEAGVPKVIIQSHQSKDLSSLQNDEDQSAVLDHGREKSTTIDPQGPQSENSGATKWGRTVSLIPKHSTGPRFPLLHAAKLRAETDNHGNHITKHTVATTKFGQTNIQSFENRSDLLGQRRNQSLISNASIKRRRDNMLSKRDPPQAASKLFSEGPGFDTHIKSMVRKARVVTDAVNLGSGTAVGGPRIQVHSSQRISPHDGESCKNLSEKYAKQVGQHKSSMKPTAQPRKEPVRVSMTENDMQKQALRATKLGEKSQPDYRQVAENGQLAYTKGAVRGAASLQDHDGAESRSTLIFSLDSDVFGSNSKSLDFTKSEHQLPTEEPRKDQDQARENKNVTFSLERTNDEYKATELNGIESGKVIGIVSQAGTETQEHMLDRTEFAEQEAPALNFVQHGLKADMMRSEGIVDLAEPMAEKFRASEIDQEPVASANFEVKGPGPISSRRRTPFLDQCETLPEESSLGDDFSSGSSSGKEALAPNVAAVVASAKEIASDNDSRSTLTFSIPGGSDDQDHSHDISPSEGLPNGIDSNDRSARKRKSGDSHFEGKRNLPSTYAENDVQHGEKQKTVSVSKKEKQNGSSPNETTQGPMPEAQPINLQQMQTDGDTARVASLLSKARKLINSPRNHLQLSPSAKSLSSLESLKRIGLETLRNNSELLNDLDGGNANASSADAEKVPPSSEIGEAAPNREKSRPPLPKQGFVSDLIEKTIPHSSGSSECRRSSSSLSKKLPLRVSSSQSLSSGRRESVSEKKIRDIVNRARELAKGRRDSDSTLTFKVEGEESEDSSASSVPETNAKPGNTLRKPPKFDFPRKLGVSKTTQDPKPVPKGSGMENMTIAFRNGSDVGSTQSSVTWQPEIGHGVSSPSNASKIFRRRSTRAQPMREARKTTTSKVLEQTIGKIKSLRNREGKKKSPMRPRRSASKSRRGTQSKKKTKDSSFLGRELEIVSKNSMKSFPEELNLELGKIGKSYVGEKDNNKDEKGSQSSDSVSFASRARERMNQQPMQAWREYLMTDSSMVKTTDTPLAS